MLSQRNCIAALTSAGITLGASMAHAVTIDFSVLPPGPQGSTTIVLPEATFTTPDGTDFFVGAAGIGSEICALSSGCEADINVDFNSLVSDLTFVTSGFNIGDQNTASIFDIDDNFLGSINIASNTFVDFTGFSGIARLFLDDNSTGAGFGFDDFTFNVAQAVPEPGVLGVLGIGLAGIGLLGRRRKTG